MEWISVEDRLPEFKKKILLYNKMLRYPHIGELMFLDERGHHFKCETIVFDCHEGKEKCCESYTHWMPLPEPPEKA